MGTPQQVLQQYWGYNGFRPLQTEIVESILAGNDTLALLPTGGGKSICFQVPALCKPGICLVISPLIALMKDQVGNLAKRNIPALSIHSGMSYYDVRDTLQNAAYGQFKFLYVSPERLETKLFKEFMGALPLNLIAVDEAHCISAWGYDFRPPYLRIANIKKYFDNIPILALTASATPMVQKDICDKLQFKSPTIFRQSFERPNLSYSVFKVDSKLNKLIEILQKVTGTGIVYCRNRRRTREIAHLLQINNISADFYHAGLPQNERSDKQEAFIKSNIRVMVCTNAFGMGIDKPDVRSVVHVDLPDNLESYYQEAGRAGRDGKKSYAVLLYSNTDTDDLAALPDQKFPSIKEIRNVYQAMANFLQIAVGNGEGLYYSFNLNEFVKNFKLNANTVVNALKAIEQSGHLTFNDQVFIPAKIGFTCSKEVLNDFELQHPTFENLVKYLLRSYAGIFDNIVSVNEKMLSKITKLPSAALQNQLAQLKAFGILDYQPVIETPQVHFIQNRASAGHLLLNQDQYQFRIKQYQQRVATMLQFVKLKHHCRSVFIGNYFGDEQMIPCGICDNCLKQKKVVLTDSQFQNIYKKLTALLPDTLVPLQAFFDQLAGIPTDHVWKVIDYLQSEHLIVVDHQGHIKKAKQKV